MPEEGNHFVELSVQRRIMQSLVSLDYSAMAARQAFGMSISAIRVGGSTVNRPMFTVKPANDTEEFHETIKAIEEQQKIKALWEEMGEAYQVTLHNVVEAACATVLAFHGVPRNLPNLPPPTVPAVSVGGTGPSPSLPHAADAP